MQIITDSASDLSAQEIRTWNIQVVPLYVQFPDEEIASTGISADDFYNRLRSMFPQIPTTSQPAVGNFTRVYEKAIAAGDDVLSIHISSGLSGTYPTAVLAARQIGSPRLTVVDTLTLSVGQRFQVLAAAMAAKAGWAIPDILERLDAIRAATQLAYTLETLEYLAKGGWIGRVQAVAGSIFQIKPVITVEKQDGKYSTLGRGRTVGQTMTFMTNHFASVFGSGKPVWVSVVHGQMPDKAEAFAADLRSRLNVAKLDILRVSPALGVHTGPGIVGAAVLPMELVEDLL